MPACVNCTWFDPLASACTIQGKPTCSARSCVAGVARLRLPKLTGDVLEIGPGVWKLPRRLMSRDATWHGIDPRFTDPAPGSRAFCGTAGSLPFPDGTFNFVFGLETMEHWHEHGEDVRKCLTEIRRVLRPGGMFLATVPIHLHGGAEFLLGNLGDIFAHFWDWPRFEAEAWRREHAPLAPAFDWQNERCSSRKALKRKFGPAAMPANWVLELNAWKGE